MDAVTLARVQFAVTVGFHFIFPPLSIGLSWFIFWALMKSGRAGEEIYGRLARFWTRILAATFAIGVASGLTMEFQFGTNWAQYSRYVGDIFGAPLAIESVFAFFLESSFLGVLIFGWKRLPLRTLQVAAFMVAFGATLSAFWIIAANSWQQTPAGFHMVDGRAELVNFAQAVLNQSTIPRFLHTMSAAMVTGAFFLLGIGAWAQLKGKSINLARHTIIPGLIVALAASLVQLGTGHLHAIQVAKTQPEKLAAIEGMFDTQTNAPAVIFGVPDPDDETVHYAIKIPGLLSLLAHGDTKSEVLGLDAFPRDDWPPLLLTFFPFHLMVALGVVFIGFPAIGLLLLPKDRLFKMRWYLFLAVLATPFPFIANELGWITTEVGRQPWAVYHLLKTADAVSPNVPASSILVSLIFFSILYLVLFVMWITALRRIISDGFSEVTE